MRQIDHKDLQNEELSGAERDCLELKGMGKAIMLLIETCEIFKLKKWCLQKQGVCIYICIFSRSQPHVYYSSSVFFLYFFYFQEYYSLFNY